MINWTAFLVVFSTSLFASALTVSLYSLGIRFLATPIHVAGELKGPARDEEDDDIDGKRPLWATAGAFTCFSLSILVVLYGIYLIVPAFHGG